MSLRARLILMVAVALAVCLALGGALASFNAGRAVNRELATALDGARRVVGNGIAAAGHAPEGRRDLAALIAAFDGNRDLRLAWRAGGAAAEPSIAPGAADVPPWFAHLIGVAPRTIELPVALNGAPSGSVIIATVPANAVLDRWDAFGDWALALVLLALAVLAAIWFLIGGAMRPLGRLAVGLGAVSRGDYAIRFEDVLPPELSRLRDNFNRMTSELARLAEQNRRLAAELLSLQEQERSELARRLQEEVGRPLAAVARGTTGLAQAATEGRGEELAGQLGAIEEGVTQARRQLRELRGRLRPIGLAEFGLAAAIGNLVDSWRRRHPEIIYLVTIAAGIAGFGETLDLAIYRIVEEGVAHSLRHGTPTRVSIALAQRANRVTGEDSILVTVADDGVGGDDEATLGYGLLAMAERVKTVGGRLNIDSKKGRGLTVTAVLPRPRVGHSAETFLS